jgi:hypothetical protein
VTSAGARTTAAIGEFDLHRRHREKRWRRFDRQTPAAAGKDFEMNTRLLGGAELARYWTRGEAILAELNRVNALPPKHARARAPQNVVMPTAPQPAESKCGRKQITLNGKQFIEDRRRGSVIYERVRSS